MKKRKSAPQVDVSAAFEGLSAHTRSVYTCQFNAYMQYARTLDEAMNPQTLASYRQHLVEKGKESVSTINVRIMAVRRVADWMYDTGKIGRRRLLELLDVSPPPKKALAHRDRQRRKPVRITSEQMRQMCDLPEATPTNPVPVRDRALLLTLATTGVRLSEIALIRTEDVVKARKGYMIRNVQGRSIPINEEVYHAIQDWLYVRPVTSPYVFNQTTVYANGNVLYRETPMGRSAAEKAIQVYGSMVGLTGLRAEDIRSFVAEQVLLRDGISAAQKVLGHKSISSTAERVAREVDTISPITF